MKGDPRWLRLLIRLANRVYFIVAQHLADRAPTRHERVRMAYGPSKRLMVALAALSRLFVLVLHPSLC